MCGGEQRKKGERERQMCIMGVMCVCACVVMHVNETNLYLWVLFMETHMIIILRLEDLMQALKLFHFV